ncbi:unnamed protein product [Blepharisma stoltei]|uniref:USP domain-containing protein n=1 Tax=Blepharisma stoltei TaxID=1481888 RepID=A0AAU9IG28_9CILI|nr:unnamed protein product [Blepharisma stoltei]
MQQEREQRRSQNCCNKFLLCLAYLISRLRICCRWTCYWVKRYCRGICDFILCLIFCRVKKQKDSDSDGQIENPNYFRGEKSLNYFHKDESVNNFSKKANYPRKLGIPNYGNICYLNSVLQVLASTPEFSNCLSQDSEISGTLLKIVTMINNRSETNFKPDIDRFLKIIYQEDPKVFSIQFVLGKQNDSKEIFAIIIDECAEINKNLKDLFFIRQDKTFICERNHQEKIVEENPFLVVLRNFDKGISSFIDSLERTIYFRDSNKIYCNTCAELKDTSITTEYNFPKILVFYFAGDTPKKRRIEDFESIKGKNYELYGMICFYPSYRHYVAFTLDSGIWRKYNDESVSEKGPDYNYAYMAFYRLLK